MKDLTHNEKKCWGVIEGLLLCFFLFIIGLLMEYFFGSPDRAFWSYPLNLIVGIAFGYSIVMSYYLGREKRWLKWLSGMKMSLSVILWMLYLSILVGIIPQTNTVSSVSGESLLAKLGFTHIVSSWFFLLNAALFLFVLGLVVIRRFMPFSWRNFVFALNHIGLWIALTGGILGAADRAELRMILPLGKTVNEAFEKGSNVPRLLSFSFELKRFILEEYSPKLVLVDKNGRYLPTDKPDIFSVDAAGVTGRLGEWDIKITEYIEEGVSGKTSDFRKSDIKGGATALYVIATNGRTKKRYEGWVSSGNFMVSPAILPLSEGDAYIVMPDREPKRFASELIIHKADGSVVEAVVDVNSPFSIDGYDIYQSSYDQEKGRWSAYSGLMLTADPALTVVYIGLYMMLAGAVLMFLSGPKKRTS